MDGQNPTPPARTPALDPAALDVRLRSTWVENVGYRYDVLLDDEVILRRSRDPEYDAARVLHARGHRGTFRTIDFTTGKPRMILDIGKAAGLRTVERDRGGLTVEPYQPLTGADRMRLRPPSLHRGRVVADGRPTDTGRPVERAGGTTAEAPAPVQAGCFAALLPEEA